MKFIKKLSLSSDLNEMTNGLNDILNINPWDTSNQIGLNYTPGATNTWQDNTGSISTRFGGKERYESDFIEWNIFSKYIKDQLNMLADIENINLGRVRFMRLNSKTGLSVHEDTGVRYHYVISTNIHSYIMEIRNNMLMGYHLPADSNWYKVDTTRKHTVYNGGWTDRIHLVVCTT